jgi:enoyl-CoA hydratase
MLKKRIGSEKCSKLHQRQKKALEAGVLIANKIAACGPLGIETTLTSAHLSIDHTEEKALSKLDVQFGALFHK